jgi:hypothetical protein
MVIIEYHCHRIHRHHGVMFYTPISSILPVFLCLQHFNTCHIVDKERSFSEVFHIPQLWRQPSRNVFSTVHLSQPSWLDGLSCEHSKILTCCSIIFHSFPVFRFVLVQRSFIILVDFGNRNSQDTACSVKALAPVFFPSGFGCRVCL